MVIICLKSTENWKGHTAERGECSRSKWTSAVTSALEAFANFVNGHKDDNPSFVPRKGCYWKIEKEKKVGFWEIWGVAGILLAFLSQSYLFLEQQQA